MITEVAASAHAIATSIAAAIEQQTLATREISNSAGRAATGTQVVVQNIPALNENICDASGATREVVSASEELSTEFRTPEKQVQKFVATIRSSG
jgi:methyl-accepting chemotaxis protein